MKNPGDPDREDHNLFETYYHSRDGDDPAETTGSLRPQIRPPRKACCAGCGSEQVSGLPYFSAGAGIAYRPVADDVICRRCGHIGSYEL